MDIFAEASPGQPDRDTPRPLGTPTRAAVEAGGAGNRPSRAMICAALALYVWLAVAAYALFVPVAGALK